MQNGFFQYCFKYFLLNLSKMVGYQKKQYVNLLEQNIFIFLPWKIKFAGHDIILPAILVF